MRRERLTPERIRRFGCVDGTKQAFLWDSVVPRLAVRATAGAKSFVFESKLNRHTIRRTIGDVGDWNLDEARIEARRLQTLIDQGIDPRELDRQQLAAKAAAKAAQDVSRREAESRQRHTLRTLCNAYVACLKERGKTRSAAEARSAFKCHIFLPCPTTADTPAHDVTSLQVAAMVRKVHEAGKERSAGILRSYLSAAFNAAKKAPFDPRLPADLIQFNINHNPVEAIPAIAVKAGERTLSVEELQAYLAALGDDLAGQALKLALFAGGQRMAQLLRATVSDYDEHALTLRLWDGKGKRREAREHLLPLASNAAALAAKLVERAKLEESAWLFSTHGKVAMAPTTPGKRVAEISVAMKAAPFDLRDIRRTCETMLAGMGVSRETRAQLLSHGISGVQATHYDRHDYLPEKRAALAAWEKRLEQIEKGLEGPNNVVALRPALGNQK